MELKRQCFFIYAAMNTEDDDGSAVCTDREWRRQRYRVGKAQLAEH